MSGNAGYAALQAKVWNGRLPLEIRLSPSDCRTFDESDPYLVSAPRLSYLPVLLPRLHAFFTPLLIDPSTNNNPFDGYFTYESVPLKWHLPLGLLYDIYCSNPEHHDPTTPTVLKLTLHFSPPSSSPTGQSPPPVPLPLLSEPILHDAFINSVKEADFLRSGTAKPIMSLSANDSKALWTSVVDHDLSTYRRIYSSLLPQTFRNIPLRVYIPSSPPTNPDEPPPSEDTPASKPTTVPALSSSQSAANFSIKVLQSHIPPTITSSSSLGTPSTRSPATTPQTLGTALHSMIPSLFPSRRIPVLAKPMLHGALVPMSAELETLARWAAYGDGWLGIVVVMN